MASKMIGSIVGDKYLLEEELGSGAFSVVWKGRNIINDENEIVAIKQISLNGINQKFKQSIIRELEILKNNIHPNIIRLYDTIEEFGKLFMILEFCDHGDLAKYIKKHRRVSSHVARDFMIQLAAGLKVFRNNNIIHRDLKPQNLLLSTAKGKKVLKIGDFGLARNLRTQDLAATICGSPLYMAPEVMQSQPYDEKADLWSIGCILYELIIGAPPFSAHSQIQLLDVIMKTNQVKFPREVWKEIHPHCIDLCRKLLRKNPVERISFDEFFAHSFIKEERLQPSKDSKTFLTKSSGSDTSASLQLSHGNHDIFGSGNYQNESYPSIREYSTKLNIPIDEWQSTCKAMMEKATKEMAALGLVKISEQAKAYPIPRDGNSFDHTDDDFVMVNKSALDNSKQKTDSLKLESPREDLEKRLESLERSAKSIAKLIINKLDSKNVLEPIGLHCVYFCLWKEVLRVCYSWALQLMGESSFNVMLDRATRELVSKKLNIFCQNLTSKSEVHEVANACAQVEDYCSQIQDTFDSMCHSFEPKHRSILTPLAMDIIFHSAIQLGKEGAGKEDAGDLRTAGKYFSLAEGLMAFIVFDAPTLDLYPAFSLNTSQHQQCLEVIHRLKQQRRLVLSKISCK